MSDNENGWNEYKRLIISQLDDLNNKTKEINNKLVEIQVHISALDAKAATWGGIVGLIVSAGTTILTKFL